MTSHPGDRPVTRRALAALAIRIASAALAFLSHVLLARWLSLDQYGLFAATWTWLLIIGGALPLGFNVAVVSLLPRCLAEGDLARARGLVGLAVGLTLALSALVSAVAIGLIVWRPAFVEGPLASLAILAILCIPLLALGDVNEGLARAMGCMGSALLPAYVARPLLILAAGSLLLLSGIELDAASVTACALLALVVSTLIQTGWIAHRLFQVIGWGPARLTARTWALVSLPMLMSELAEMLLASLDVLVVAAWVGPSEAGVYLAAQRSIALVAFVSFAVGAATASSIAASAPDPARVAIEVRRAATLAFWPTLAAAIVLVGAAPGILAVFGPRFIDGTTVVAILAVGFVARSFVGPAELLLNAVGAERACAVILAVHVAVGLALHAALVPTFGILGAASATSATMVSLSIAFAAYAWLSRGLVMAPSWPMPEMARLARPVH
jgi:O-antigen/teichoic acid export membrane protein